ncbi:D-lactate ferricytochrome c oxidoreductase, partial [Teratosphaeriaceae sp. CCFEE 6253]
DAPARPQSHIKYTTDSYPSIKRDSRFKACTADDVAHFRSILDSDAAVLDGVTNETGEEDFAGFNTDWMKKYRGKTRL